MIKLLPFSLLLNLVLVAALVLRDPPTASVSEHPSGVSSSLPLHTANDASQSAEPDRLFPNQTMSVPSLDGLNYGEQLTALMEQDWAEEDAKIFLLGRALREQTRWMLDHPSAPTPNIYWRLPQDLPRNQERLRIAKEKQQQVEEAMEALFGKDHLRKPYDLRPALPFSQEKRNALIAWEQDYQTMSAKIYAAASGFLLPEDREALALLEQEKAKDLEAILSPDELFEYRLRTSDTAAQLRRELDAINPTEEEFRTVFQLRYELDQLRTDQTSHDDEAHRLYHEANETLKTRFREILGEDRYRRYERGRNRNYSRLTALTKRLQLPPERVDEVLDIHDSARARQDALHESENLSTEDRQAALQALRNEARAGIRNLLGERGSELYEQHAGGDWLNRLD